MDGWMDCNFTSFLTVFQLYQDSGGGGGGGGGDGNEKLCAKEPHWQLDRFPPDLNLTQDC